MNNIDRQYREILEHILHFGVDKKDRTGTGTKSIFGWQIRHNMKEGFPLLTTKKMAWKTMVTELLWFLRGDTNIKYLVDNGCHIWDGDAYKNYLTKNLGKSILPKEEFIKLIKLDDEFAKKWGELGPIYGAQWRRWGGLQDLTDDDKPIYLDQIENLISELKTNPDSRRLMVSAWNVGELNQMVLPPCHYGFQVYTRKLSLKERYSIAKYDWPPDGLHNVAINRLEQRNIPRRAISLMWNQRSVDTFLGLPFNIASYALLLEIIAKAVNMIPDELIGNLGDVHLYNNHIEQAKEQITRTPFELPRLIINNEFWNHEYQTIDGWINSMEIADFTLENYQSHSVIKAPLSN
jgi:thymidylate synthase